MGVAWTRYRAAIVGLGRIGSTLEDDPLREKPASHAGALTGNPRVHLVGGYDTDADRRIAFAERWGVSCVPGSFARLLEECDPHILVVATHPDSHRYYVVRALRRGVPLVICEKPLAHTLRDARRITVTAKRRVDSTVMVNHERRYSADYRAVREAVRLQHYGRLISITGTLYFGNRARHAAVFRHDGTHLVDAINFVTDDTLVVRRRVGSMRRRSSSSYLHGLLRKSRTPVVIEVGAERDYLQLDLTLSFSSGRIEIGNGRFRWEESMPSPFYSGYRSLSDRHRTLPEPTGYFAGMVADAVDCLDDQSLRPASTADDAVAVMRVIRSLRALL